LTEAHSNEAAKIAGAARALRALRGWTQAELASRLGIAPATLRTIERGRSTEGENYMPRICKAVGVRVGDYVDLMSLYDRSRGRVPSGKAE
jgi:transcriptional regulator with XRE-family HTH domain